MHVFNVHLGTGFLERRQQARKLLSPDILHHEELRGPKIVAGDFNEWTRGLASRLMGSTFQSVDLKKLLRYRRTYPGVMPLLHLDHVLLRRSLPTTKFSPAQNPRSADCLRSPADRGRFFRHGLVVWRGCEFPDNLHFALAAGAAIGMEDLVKPCRWLAQHVRLLPGIPPQICL